ncbi:protein NIM1-INTERACTING 1-like [Helianthus annuus]|uniref:protein NIM1-INTERACTING 1-like n=1 Tax=Helianthus annuus TaxID=4232 RepID=UPI000B90489C|nr:protein NIM1-INTERACTING 1-like [Helianthus annuus]
MENHKNITRTFDDEHDDEKKMEIFFSLVRSFREARDQRKQELAEMEKANKTRKLHHFQSPSSSSFERQDFHVTLQDDQHPNKKLHNHEEHQEDDDKLNLKLSL